MLKYFIILLIFTGQFLFSQEIVTIHNLIENYATATTAEEVAMIQIEDTTDSSATIRDTPVRGYYTYAGIGVLEFYVLGFGRQLNHRWAISFKANATFLSGDYFNGAFGSGIKITRFIDQNATFFNVINLESTYLFFNGFSLEATIGRENIEQHDFNFIWSIGGVVSSGANAPPLYMVSAKIGIGWNL